MKMLYAAKSFGQYHFFSTEEKRAEWIHTLPEWEQKHVETWTEIIGKGK